MTHALSKYGDIRQTADATVWTVTPDQLRRLPEEGWTYDGHGDRWYGGSRDFARSLLANGARHLVAEAKALASKLDHLASETGKQWSIAAHIAGGAVCVPAVLAGHPAAFRRSVPVPSPRGIRIYVDLCTSSGYSAQAIKDRGLATLTMARKLSLSRPVELYAVNAAFIDHAGAVSVTVIPLGVNPIDWSTAGALLGEAAVYRHTLIGASYCVARGEIDGSYMATRPAFGNRDRERVREILGLQPNDLLLSGTYLGDKSPLEWAQEQLSRLEGSTQ